MVAWTRVVAVQFWMYFEERTKSLRGERKGGVTGDTKDFGQNNWKNGVAMNKMRILTEKLVC